MKTKEEIEIRIEECTLQLEHLNEWHEKAYEKYKEERKRWGKDTDRGEMDHISDLQSELIQEIKLLRWVLGE